MRIRSFGGTDVGTTRSENEDTYFTDDALGLYIVCDGMGGHNFGKVASENAVVAAVEFVRNHIDQYTGLIMNEQTCADLSQLARESVLEACKKVFEMSQNNPRYQGMGTTMTLLLIQDSKCFMAHVGDSRLYLHRRGTFHQISSDHTLIHRLISEGTLDPTQAKNSPYQHVLTRCVGRDESVQVDTLVFDLLPHDMCLMCTDGFSNCFTDIGLVKELFPLEETDLLTDEELSSRIPDLLQYANDLDGSDNLTALFVLATEGEDQAAEKARSEEVFLRIDTLKKMYLFEELTLQEILRVMDYVQVLDCPASHTLITEGEQSDALYLILSGKFQVSHAEKQLDILHAGSHFGEIALISEVPRTATVQALEAARLLVIEREGFMRLVQQDKPIGVALLWKLAEQLSARLARANDWLQ